MSTILIEDVGHVSSLARLNLTGEEKSEFTEELGEILNYVETLNLADTSDVMPVSQISGLANIARSDEITNKDQRDKMLQNAPETKDGFIRVKKVFE